MPEKYRNNNLTSRRTEGGKNMPSAYINFILRLYSVQV